MAGPRVDVIRKGHGDKKSKQVTDCKFCGKDHLYGKCSAFHTKCSHCGRIGHWKVRCLQVRGQDDSPKGRYRHSKFSRTKDGGGNRRVHAVDVEPGEACEKLSFAAIHSSTKASVDNEDIMVHVDVKIPDCNRPAEMLCKVDTGAQGNVLPLRTFRKMFPSLVSGTELKYGQIVVKRPHVRLYGYGGSEITQCGSVKLRIGYPKLNKQWHEAEFFIVDTTGPIVLGKHGSIMLKIITVNTVAGMTLRVSDASLGQVTPIPNTKALMDIYPDRFEGIGRFPGKYHIDTKPEVNPVIHPPRKYPIHLKEEIQAELDKMMEMDVIEHIPENESTEWLSSLAFSRKESGGIRICLDPRELNAGVKRTYHRTPSIEEITHKLTGAKFFNKLDARHGYWSIELDRESSALTAFNAPSGRYRFKRLPFGLHVAQDVFQEKMDAILAGCKGTMSITDDIVVFGTSVEDHDRNLHGLILRARECGLVFNSGKSVIRSKEVNFFGMIYTTEGIRPDPKKSSEIADLPSPTGVKDLQRFLGMVQYLAPFIPNLSDKTSILRGLIKKDTPWDWTPMHQSAFQAIKDEICNTVTLSYFNLAHETRIQVDASMKGLGATLIQIEDGREKVIAFASKALSPTEERYANIEREMLAVVFGAERFYTFVYGSSFTVESDHKPLESIHLKSISQAPPRLQRMLLRIQPYDMKIKYRPGKELLLADALSRIQPRQGGTINLEKTIHCVRWSEEKLDDVRRQTDTDAELQPLMEVVTRGWLEDAKMLPKCLRSYWSIKDFLAVEDGILMKGQRLMIPKCLQREVLERLHVSHQGIEKTRLRARTCVYWRGIDKDIEDMVVKCSACLEFSKSEQKQSMIPHDLPSSPWQKLGSDLFEFEGQHYLIVADYYSKMPFIRHLNSESSRAVIAKMKMIFSELGVPELLFTDGGPCYSIREFRDFAKSWGIRHVMSSPHYPQSNGFVERAIQTVKLTMKKARRTGTDPELALLCVRATPLDARVGSPADLLYGRPLRTNLLLKTRGSEDVVSALRF